MRNPAPTRPENSPAYRGRAGSTRSELSAQEIERRRKNNEKQTRYQQRKAMGQRFGRFLITESLLTALVRSGAISDRDAEDQTKVEAAVGRLLNGFVQDISSR